jgi:zinc transport system substrate-binding protein
MKLSEIPKLKFREKNIFEHTDDHKDDQKDEHGHKDGHAHGEYDAHLWLDPLNAKIILKEVARVLSEVDPSNAKKYNQNANNTRIKIDKMISDIGNDINKSARFITFHDAYQFFEKRFSIASMGSLTVNPDVQPGAKQVSDIQKLIKEKNIKCIFSEPQFNPKLIAMIAKNTSTRTGVFDPLGSKLAPGKSLYFNVIRNLANNLKGC